MTDDEQRVDPRYDPAFQRGFEGQVTSGLRTRNSVRRSALVSPAAYRSGEPETDEATVEPEAEEPRSSADPDPMAAPEEAPVRSVTARELRRNPFLVVLVALGGALVLTGIAWAFQARQMVAGLATELDYWFLEASIVGAPMTIISGIVVLAGVLFLAAAAWNRR